MPEKNLRYISEGIFRFHEYFGVFIVYEKEISRPVRFLVYYVKLSVLIAVSGLFS